MSGCSGGDGCGGGGGSSNQPPRITLASEHTSDNGTATLNAQVSDADGDPVQVRWTLVEGAADSADTGDPTATALDVRVPRVGSYRWRLSADDGRGG